MHAIAKKKQPSFASSINHGSKTNPLLETCSNDPPHTSQSYYMHIFHPTQHQHIQETSMISTPSSLMKIKSKSKKQIKPLQLSHYSLTAQRSSSITLHPFESAMWPHNAIAKHEYHLPWKPSHSLSKLPTMAGKTNPLLETSMSHSKCHPQTSQSHNTHKPEPK